MGLLLIFEVYLGEFSHRSCGYLKNDYGGVYLGTKGQNNSRSIRTLIYIDFRSIRHYI